MDVAARGNNVDAVTDCRQARGVEQDLEQACDRVQVTAVPPS